jgi:hypothetical protein
MGIFAKKGRSRKVELKDDPAPVIQWYKDDTDDQPAGFLALSGASLQRDGETLIVTPALGAAELVLSDFEAGECEIWEKSMLALADAFSRSRMEVASAQLEAAEVKAAAAAAVQKAARDAETLVSEQKRTAEEAVLAAKMDAKLAVEAADAQALSAVRQAKVAERERQSAVAALEQERRQTEVAKHAEQVFGESDRIAAAAALAAASAAADAAEERANALAVELESCTAERTHLKLQLLIESDRAHDAGCAGASDFVSTAAPTDLDTCGRSVVPVDWDAQSPSAETRLRLVEGMDEQADTVADRIDDVFQLWLSAPGTRENA